MTDQDITSNLRKLIENERKTTSEILCLINLVEDRKIYLARGYSSLCKWLVKEFKYSETSANRRIQTARVLRLVPSIRQDISSGRQNITNVTKLQTVIRAEERASSSRV